MEEAALEQAEAQCLADKDARSRPRARPAAPRRPGCGVRGAASGGAVVPPACPAGRAAAIARHAAVRGSGRVGRSAAGRALNGAVTLAVVASVRHQDTDLDELLRSACLPVAREQVRPPSTESCATPAAPWPRPATSSPARARAQGPPVGLRGRWRSGSSHGESLSQVIAFPPSSSLCAVRRWRRDRPCARCRPQARWCANAAVHTTSARAANPDRRSRPTGQAGRHHRGGEPSVGDGPQPAPAPAERTSPCPAAPSNASAPKGHKKAEGRCSPPGACAEYPRINAPPRQPRRTGGSTTWVATHQAARSALDQALGRHSYMASDRPRSQAVASVGGHSRPSTTCWTTGSPTCRNQQGPPARAVRPLPPTARPSRPPLLGEHPVSSLGTLHLQQLYAWLARDGRWDGKAGGLGPAPSGRCTCACTRRSATP